MARVAISEFKLETADAQQAADNAKTLMAFLRSHSAPTSSVRVMSTSHGEETTSVALPAAAFRFLADVLAELGNGKVVTVASGGVELTIRQAADLLDLKPAQLVELLDAGRIPYRVAGESRTILLDHVTAFKRHDHAYRRAVANELTREAQLTGLEY